MMCRFYLIMKLKCSYCKVSDVCWMQEFSVIHLRMVDHAKAYVMETIWPKWLNLKCATKDNFEEFGLFTIRHMETFMGDQLWVWISGWVVEAKKKGVAQWIRCYSLKYTTEILLAYYWMEIALMYPVVLIWCGLLYDTITNNAYVYMLSKCKFAIRWMHVKKYVL